MEWTNETVLKFLELYEKEPAIWNASHIQYKNRHDVYDAWLRIKNNLNTPCSIETLKKKKESLMSSFRTCLNKVKQSKQSRKSGARVDEIYKPTWFAFETMARFLKNKGKDQPIETTTSEDINSKLPDESSESGTAEHLEELSDEMNISEPDENVGTKLRKFPARRTFKIPQNKKVRSFCKQDAIIHKQMQKAYSTLKNNAQKDDCDLYCELLAGKLRKMDERTRDIVMNQIDNFVFRTKMGYSQSQFTSLMYFNEQPHQQADITCRQPPSPSLLHISSSQLSNVSHSSSSQPDLSSSID